MSASDRVPLTDEEEQTAQLLADYARNTHDTLLCLTRELVALRTLLAACRVSRRSLPPTVERALKRFGPYASGLRQRLADADHGAQP